MDTNGEKGDGGSEIGRVRRTESKGKGGTETYKRGMRSSSLHESS